VLLALSGLAQLSSMAEQLRDTGQLEEAVGVEREAGQLRRLADENERKAAEMHRRASSKVACLTAPSFSVLSRCHPSHCG
jgi:hypothetical protein